MKKIIICSAAALVMTVSIKAQTTNTINQTSTEVNEGMKDLRGELRDVKKDKHKLRNKLKKGDYTGAKEIGKDIRSDKREIHQGVLAQKDDGVKHPVRHADRQMHRAHKKRVG